MTTKLKLEFAREGQLIFNFKTVYGEVIDRNGTYPTKFP